MCQIYFAYYYDLNFNDINTTLLEKNINCKAKIVRKAGWSLIPIETKTQKETTLVSLGQFRSIYTEKAEKALKDIFINKPDGEAVLERDREAQSIIKRRMQEDAYNWMDFIYHFVMKYQDIGLLFTHDEKLPSNFEIMEIQVNEININTLLYLKENTLLIIHNIK